ncbi:uncharacterized protein BXZ73DRAFT_102538 [Epithele typhae]|uniref:uncharacterized protein n=1 Tax=Epithele typhae TaxID=378194 RepID=UPI002007828D|nr:uncharacterized protein BXZ73DRAFT_102538 [Epithele typhae]KAH9928033.1 hypothetical protein BXZ73DRAFT_102538 [Epithele typhae]
MPPRATPKKRPVVQEKSKGTPKATPKAASTKVTPAEATPKPKATPKSAQSNGKSKRPTKDDDYDSDMLDEDDEDEGDAYHLRDASGDGASSSHSGSLDEDDYGEDDYEELPNIAVALGKRKPFVNKVESPHKKRKTKSEDEDEDEDSELELEDGQEVVGKIVHAPKTGRVPAGRISQNTLNFLADLATPECNDREWFKLHEPVFRQAEKEWKDFVEKFTDALVEVDEQIPHLPPKDLVYRIYRDTRFSNDKTPYKDNFAATFTRSGRKGIFAGCSSLVPTFSVPSLTHLRAPSRPCREYVPTRPPSVYASPLTPPLSTPVKAGVAHLYAGASAPGKNELATIRNNLQRSSRRFRRVISAPDFEARFGEATPHPKGLHQNVYGMEDQLKVAPKSVAKTHPDIDLLKCRSYVVKCGFTVEQMLSPNFIEELAGVVAVARPFVHCLNDLMTVQDADADDSDEDEQ